MVDVKPLTHAELYWLLSEHLGQKSVLSIFFLCRSPLGSRQAGGQAADAGNLPLPTYLVISCRSPLGKEITYIVGEREYGVRPDGGGVGRGGPGGPGGQALVEMAKNILRASGRRGGFRVAAANDWESLRNGLLSAGEVLSRSSVWRQI